LEDPDVDYRIILKQILEKWDRHLMTPSCVGSHVGEVQLERESRREGMIMTKNYCFCLLHVGAEGIVTNC
jgi:hypothetical protein